MQFSNKWKSLNYQKNIFILFYFKYLIIKTL